MVAALTGIVGLSAFVWVGLFWFIGALRDARGLVHAVGSSPPAGGWSTRAGIRSCWKAASNLAARALSGAALDANPNVRVVRLESRGGRVAEGLALGTLLRDRNVDTFVNGECSSACVTAFSGGARRIISANARVGLHSAGGAGFSANTIASANRRSDEFIAARGVDQRVLEKGASIKNDQIWFPSAQVLLGSGLATELASQ